MSEASPGRATTEIHAPRIGCVIIGRNEGRRLETSLRSLNTQCTASIYVDSGSTDGSPELAESLGYKVHRLDPSLPFTAARARNAGARLLTERQPDLEMLQFVDGDCEIDANWLCVGSAALAADPTLAVVVGQGCERDPQSSVYQRLADIEWRTTPGEILACGGIALIRAKAFQSVNGYASDLIAGEEPEMCLRLRRAGWRLRCLDAPMMTHDLGMTRIRQWWQRSRRAGYAAAEGARQHGRSPERYRVKEVRRALFWGALWPATIALAAYPTQGYSILMFTSYLYPARGAMRYARRCGADVGTALEYALFNMMGKFAECSGVLGCWLDRLRRRQPGLIEHK